MNDFDKWYTEVVVDPPITVDGGRQPMRYFYALSAWNHQQAKIDALTVALKEIRASAKKACLLTFVEIADKSLDQLKNDL